ncbi:hypothetical protein [Herbaspirillum sp. alder98]|uniref:hypothetical protein n=1 Tax=Herbaspirillum sp. alder98 TaxID=2913096 RepID=UPI001CD8F673|nr:hypothetical protein [Herbaspirillum sp. alder98]MCA1323250.1 hypothetical protein [Herbaspirillum sp. alder98]
MDKKLSLLTSITELKRTHDAASVLLSGLMMEAVRAVRNENAVPTLKTVRQYRKAIKDLKLQCLQVEMILAELDIPQHVH